MVVTTVVWLDLLSKAEIISPHSFFVRRRGIIGSKKKN